MTSQSSTQGREEQIFAYFDGELDPSEHALIESEIGENDALAGQISDLSFMREIVVGTLERQADRLPEARFEQIWDNFEASLERESRMQEAAEAPPRLWRRLLDLARPVRVPLAVAGLAGLLALVFVRSVGAPDQLAGVNASDEREAPASNTPEAPASDQPASEAAGELPSPQPASQLAAAPNPTSDVTPEMFPAPEPGEAEIRHIEFGGRSGTISQIEGARGTTTVIWVSEEVAPVDTERSL